ncbi:universal stress protein [Alteromonas sediminis]|uniref:Universal stress protein n=1 Tax=Alteromonas sediminis TaxID=2259342 RepID=A0A3N5Y2U6_9ALTE|nr:universal stress protein [Alteromonas sediminis]RPJ67393.1 universal stress protein [Alteromonas sediminis]
MEQPNVVAGIDGSKLSTSVADYASWIAQTVGVPLTFLHNLEHREPPVSSDLSGSIGLGSREHLLDELIELEARRNKLLVEEGKSMLDTAKERASQVGVEHCTTLQRHGVLSETLVELEDSIRVLVLGARGEDHEEGSSALGHQIESIIRALHKPVLIVNREFRQPKRLLLAYDGSEAANKALNWLCTSPLYKSMTCHVVHVCDKSDKGSQLLAEAKQTLEAAGVSAETRLIEGNAETELLGYQHKHNIDLLVMGSFGHSRLREMLLGSFTLKMLNKASIPLLLLR